MPYYRRRRAIRRRAPLRRKRLYKRKVRRNNATTMRFKPGLAKGVLVADRYFLKQRFTYVNNTSAETAGVFSILIKGNSIHNVAGGSGEAQGSSALANLYNKWRIHGSSILVRFANSDSTNQILAVTPANSDITGEGSQAFLDQSYSKFTQVGPLTGNGKGVVKSYMTTKRMYGLKRIDQEEDLVGLTTPTDPSQLWYWNVNLFNANNASTTGGQLYIEIMYFIEYFDRKPISTQA